MERDVEFVVGKTQKVRIERHRTQNKRERERERKKVRKERD